MHKDLQQVRIRNFSSEYCHSDLMYMHDFANQYKNEIYLSKLIYMPQVLVTVKSTVRRWKVYFWMGKIIVCCLAGYVIERRLTTEKKWEKVDSVDASVTLYCVENLREKSEYEFRVFAENPVGRSLEPAMTEQVRLKTHASKCRRQAWW